MAPLVVFDIGNVLLKFSIPRAGKNFDRREPGLGKSLVDFIWNSPWMEKFETGRIRGKNFYALMKKDLGFSLSYADFCAAFNDIFTPIPHNLSLLREISERLPTALLSNVNDIHWRHIHRRYAGLRHAHFKFGSHDLGVMKPHPRAYQKVSEKTGVPLKRMVYVDDREDFIHSARRLGIAAIHYTGRRPLRIDFEELGILPGRP